MEKMQRLEPSLEQTKDKATMMDEDPILLQEHHLLLEVVNDQNDVIYKTFGNKVEFGKLFFEQLHSRNLLFDKLLTKFSYLICFDDKRVTQQAAAIQALCSTHLTESNKNYINFQKILVPPYGTNKRFYLWSCTCTAKTS
eukprot:15358257-Ditylum_brightwellii.AAC.1